MVSKRLSSRPPIVYYLIYYLHYAAIHRVAKFNTADNTNLLFANKSIKKN